MTATLYLGDVRDMLPKLADESVDVVMTSSPYWLKRSYLPTDHEDKHLEIGAETNPGDFIDTLLGVMDELHRIIAPHGVVWWNLADTAGGSGGAGGDYNEGGRREGQNAYSGPARAESVYTGRTGRSNKRRDRMQDEAIGLIPPTKHSRRRLPGHVLDKSQYCIPETFRFGLAYGFNPLTRVEHTQWICRPKALWCKARPSVGELIDCYREATEPVILATKNGRYFFDLDAVRSPRDYASRTVKTGTYEGHQRYEPTQIRPDQACNPLGAPPLDWWQIGTSNYNGAHYAVMPDELLQLPITVAPERICRVCNKPWEKLVICEACGASGGNSYRRTFRRQCTCPKVSERPWKRTDEWWQPCDHNDWRPGVVLDPFAGTGTTGLVATRHGRDALLIDLDERNEKLIRERLGLFMGEVVA